MKNSEELLQFVQSHKSKIKNCLTGGTLYTTKSLKNMMKHERNALVLLTLEESFELCWILKTSLIDVEKMINYPNYLHYEIKKKRGGRRHIFSPDSQLKAVQKTLNYFLQSYYLCVKPEVVHGFVVNPPYLEMRCNIVENAKVHVGKKYVLNIDLKDFFPGINAKRVQALFTKSSFFQCNQQIGTAITLLTTYNGRLPIGAPTSPVISNFICYQLDCQLSEFSERHGLIYSRYADDLTFSSDAKFEEKTILEISALIESNHFKINEKKFRIISNFRRQTVTGLTVNEKVNVDRKLLKKIRAMLHDLSINGAEHATRQHFKWAYVKKKDVRLFIKRLEGYINFVGQVRGRSDTMFLKFKSEFDLMFSGLKYDLWCEVEPIDDDFL
jgi:RNA-directed DNA polymerase